MSLQEGVQATFLASLPLKLVDMEKYTDGLLDEKFKVIEEKMDDHFDALTGILGDIKTQTTLTNGRVNKHEGRWQFLMGGWAVFSIIVLPTLGGLCWMVVELSKEVEVLKTSVDVLLP